MCEDGMLPIQGRMQNLAGDLSRAMGYLPPVGPADPELNALVIKSLLAQE